MVPADVVGSDTGSWSALCEVGAKDQRGNLLKGRCIQIQAGDYLGEDDIERFDDIYLRPSGRLMQETATLIALFTPG